MAENARKEREKAISEDAEHEDDHQSVYEETMRDLRIVAEESYQAELQREREARRWSSGSSAPPAWLLSEQQAIWDKAIQGSEFPQTPLDAADPAHSDEQPPGDSSPVATRPPSVRSRTISQAVAPDAADDGSPRSRSERRPSLTASSAPKLVPEIWRPSITPDEDAHGLTPGLHAAQGQHRQRALRHSINSTRRGYPLRPQFQKTTSRVPARAIARETDHVGGTHRGSSRSVLARASFGTHLLCVTVRAAVNYAHRVAALAWTLRNRRDKVDIPRRAIATTILFQHIRSTVWISYERLAHLLFYGRQVPSLQQELTRLGCLEATVPPPPSLCSAKVHPPCPHRIRHPSVSP
ncbi:hypothetical protein BD626DRAFT_140159 [Schizophyllum amplum]|uniref:Uncharacterized protein n=1 Tax=Schizophyllum amplum TaxID=97359 RepID=A0A550C5A3_9AGAR|nr:hypothetical protein BD626DRAFT_140159 [Auriculariopsis ampla]